MERPWLESTNTSPDPLFLPFDLLRLATLVRHVHALEHIIGEEEFSVRGHHHDLQLVREPFGNDLVDQQRIPL